MLPADNQPRAGRIRQRVESRLRPLRLAFTTASPPRGLNQATRSELVGSFFNRNAVTPPPCGDLGLRLLVSVWFQILFHRPPGLLLTFPSRYLFTIDHEKYLALRHSRRCFIRDFTSPVLLTKNRHEVAKSFTYGAITRFGRRFQVVQLNFTCSAGTLRASPTILDLHLPRNGSYLYLPPVVQILLSELGTANHATGLGCSPFARHYSGNIADRLRPPCGFAPSRALARNAYLSLTTGFFLFSSAY